MTILRIFLTSVTTLALSLSLEGSGRVVWDISHTPLAGYHPDDQYRTLAMLLRDRGYRIIIARDEIAERGVWDADIFVVSVLSNYETAYTTNQITAVRHFVEAGGGLLVLADNNAARPRNISDLLTAFAVRGARDDRLGTLARFAQGELFAGLGSVELGAGSALEVDSAQGATAGAFDADGRIGLALSSAGAGRVVVIGDADLWVNRLIGAADNARLATNCFAYLDRRADGRIRVAPQTLNLYLPVGARYQWDVGIANDGEGALGFRARAAVGTPATPGVEYGVVAAGESSLLSVTISAVGLRADALLRGSIAIRHSDPAANPITLTITLHVVSDRPVHFRPPAPTGVDHSLLISELTLNGDSAPVGLEVGLFTPDGVCAGAARFSGGAVGVAARGDDPGTQQVEGLRRGEPFAFQYYTPWDGVELPALAQVIEGDALFVPDGFTRLTLDGRPGVALTLDLTARWSMVSLNLVPASLHPADIFAPLLAEGRLLLVKDGLGRFWDVGRGFSNLGDWDIRRGYAVKVAQPGTLDVVGAAADPTQVIALRGGWNLVAYLPQEPRLLTDALACLGENLQMVKRGDGAFWLRRWGWDGIGALEPGLGYQLWVLQPADLIYPEGGDRMAAAPRPTPRADGLSDRSLSLLLLGLEQGASIRVLAAGREVGAGIALADGRAGIAVWGDDPLSPDYEGAVEGELLSLVISGRNRNVRWLEGDGRMRAGELAVAEAMPPLPTTVTLRADIHPNPLNDRATLRVKGVRGSVELLLYDTNGRLLAVRRPAGLPVAGVWRAELDAGNLPSGVLFLRVRSDGNEAILKAVHLP